MWDVAGGVCVVTLGGHENGVCVLGLPDGKVSVLLSSLLCVCVCVGGKEAVRGGVTAGKEK